MHEHIGSPLRKMLYTLLKVAKQDMMQRFKNAQVEITPLQYWILLLLQSASATLNELAKQFDMKAPSLLPSVDALEKMDYLERKPHSDDRRKIQLMITQKGVQLIKKLSFDEQDSVLNKAFQKLTSTKQQQLLNLLQEITTEVSKRV